MKEIKKSFGEINFAKILAAKAGLYDRSILAKADNAAADMQVNGTLMPQKIRENWTRVIDQSDVLKLFKRINVKATSGNLDVFTVSTGNFVRPTVGTVNTTLANFNTGDQTNVGNAFALQEMQARIFIPYKTIQDNLDNPNFKTETFKRFDVQNVNDILKYTHTGTADTGVSDTTLQKGYTQLMKDSISSPPTAGAVNLYDNNGSTDMMDIMYNMLITMPAEFQTPQITYFMSPDNYMRYVDQRHSIDTNNRDYDTGEARPYFGKRVVQHNYLADGTIWLTDPQNLALVVGDNEGMMSFDLFADPEARGFKGIFNVMYDYQLINNKGIVLSYDA